MNVKELIENLKQLPEDTLVYVDCSSDYEDHEEATRIVKGNGGHSIGGGYFRPSMKFNAIEIR